MTLLHDVSANATLSFYARKCFRSLWLAPGPKIWTWSLPGGKKFCCLHCVVHWANTVGTLILPFTFNCDLLQPHDLPLFTEMKVSHLHNNILPHVGVADICTINCCNNWIILNKSKQIRKLQAIYLDTGQRTAFYPRIITKVIPALYLWYCRFGVRERR